jgi:hypothetical protein
VRTAAAELPGPLALDDALEVLALIHRADPDRYGRGAARWAANATLAYADVDISELALLVAALGDPDGDLVDRVRGVLHRPDPGTEETRDPPGGAGRLPPRRR